MTWYLNFYQLLNRMDKVLNNVLRKRVHFTDMNILFRVKVMPKKCKFLFYKQYPAVFQLLTQLALPSTVWAVTGSYILTGYRVWLSGPSRVRLTLDGLSVVSIICHRQ